MDEGSPFDVEALLANQGWVRSLALRLVGDADLADDIVQQTWIAALENPPRSQATLRGWLSSVVRRLSARAHRDRYLRRKHDLRVVPPGPLAGPAELLELAERQQQVVALVLELEEPYRSIILRRFFLDWTPEEIARRTGLPAPTVRTHLRRALLRLRERLDRENGGDRAKWVRALLPLAAIPAARGSASAAAGALPSALGTSLGWLVVMMTSVKIVVPVALVVGAVILSIARPWEGPGARGVPPEVVRRDSAAPGEGAGAAAAESTALPQGADDRPQLRGTLVDEETGDPIPGFPVEIRRAAAAPPPNIEEIEELVARATSNPRGEFRFAGLPAGEYRVAPGRDERIELRGEAATVQVDGANPTEVVLSCEIRWFVSGTVVVAGGSEEPVPKCFLQVVARDGTVISSGTTDEQGHFQLADSVPRGPATVCAAGAEVTWFHADSGWPDYSARLDLRNIAPGDEDLTRLVLEYPWNGVLEGVVLNGESHPIERARVRVLSGHFAIELWNTFWARTTAGFIYEVPEQVTGPDGRFRFERLPSDRPLRLAATAPGMASTLGESSRILEGHRHEVIQLIAPGVLRGVVRLPDGTAVPGAMIFAHPPGGGPGHGVMPYDISQHSDPFSRSRSDRDGRFELPVAPGRYHCGARAPHLRQPEVWWKTPQVEVASGETVEIEIELLPGGALEMSGRVIDRSSEPLARRPLQLVEAESRRYLLSAERTDGEGRFRFRNLSEGRYSVLVLDLAEHPWYPLSIVSESGPFPAGTDGITIVHDPERCRLELRVVDAETGDGLRSYLWCGPPNASGEFEYSAGMETERDGRRSLVIPPGPYDMLVDAAGHVARVERIDLEPDEPNAPPRSLEIRLPRGRVASGIVVDARGRPVSDIQVGVVFETAARPELLRNSVVMTGLDGAFTIDSLPSEGGRIAAVRRLSIVPGTVTDADREPLRIVIPDEPEQNAEG